ncbi:hypothetical protein Nepgr_006964 [Nepenthes gracilis]|uniref:Uncharacterized protein n=1 Tax=Nepenthes gracilis TaxID=150966 RepID=A0AAD3S6C1_NEPGR|nr:hypothetical protein Nepgr_006964 [Nepenthes gracilis]
MGSDKILLWQKMVLFVLGIWHSVSNSMLTLFSGINKWLFRFQEKRILRGSDPIYRSDSNRIKTVSKDEGSDSNSEFEETGGGGEEEPDEPKSFLSFRFQTYEEFSSRAEGNSGSINDESYPESNENCFQPEKTLINGPFAVENTAKISSEREPFHGSNPEEIGLHKESSERLEELLVESLEQFGNIGFEKAGSESLKELPAESPLQLGEDDLTVSSDSDSLIGSSKFSIRSSLLDLYGDGFLSDSDSEFDNSMDFDVEDMKSLEDFQNLEKGYETDDFEGQDEEMLQELKNLENGNGNLDSEFNEKSKEPQFGGNDEKPISGKYLDSDSEDSNELETLWEHQDLVEQLKMEIRKVRATGLPTILEESESPKIMDDLKPWKIEEKFQHDGTIHEVHKFYKSYRERMRKLDIFNYQKMYAIGFLRLKDPLAPFWIGRNSAGTIAAAVWQECWPCKPKASELNPMSKFSRELESDLEMVYVGQLCLSWEFLHWEYGKALEIWDSDPHGILLYNEVAGEFQQFQVLLQRFLEDEPFQGPRIPNYVKNRCLHRQILQVPVIREDSMKNRKKEINMGRGKDAFTSVMLVEIIEESIRLFWQFVRKDKDARNTILKCRRGSNLQLHNPADAELLLQVRANLQKKEKKLKELRRSEIGILRQLRKHQEDGTDGVLYFFSRVDFKLVSRVLNMSKLTTDQLIWCNNKLNRIQFFNGKISVEPSFLLFPCS